MKVNRVNKGIYTIVKDNRLFKAEKVSDGQWQLLEIVKGEVIHETIEYINHYLDLKSCKVAVQYYL